MRKKGRFPHTVKLFFKVITFLSLAGSPAILAQGTGYWHTSGTKILDSNNVQVRIAGINWYGFETTRAVAGGLTSQDYKAVLQTIKSLGYNTIRVPMSNQMVESPSVPSSISYNNGMNADLVGLNSLQILDRIVSYAGTLGLKVILDNHRSEAGDSAESNGLWYTSSYSESAWIGDWTALANRYLNNPTVIGFDLRNEPHNANSGGSCWDCGSTTNDWHLAATRGGNAVLAINPKLLIFVEGTDAYNNDYYWWGGNLEGVQNSPVSLSVANQLVYSAHDYGPSVYGQSWFNGSTTYSSLSSVWTTHWAYVEKNGIAPIWLGEFGTPNDAASVQSSTPGSEGQWFQSLVQFLGADNKLSWTYWALNGEDSLALLDSNYDPTPVSSTKQSLLSSIQFPLNPGTTTVPAAPTNLAAAATSANAVNLSWTASSTAGVTYTLYSGTSSGTTTNILASGVSSPSYAAAGLSASTTYYFTVKAVSSSGTSAASNQASATTQAAPAPAAPSGLSGTVASSSQINLAWTASTTASVTYSVYSGTASGSTTTLLAAGISPTSYAATGLNASTTYYFTVKAVTAAGGVSGASNQVSAQTQTAPVPTAPSGLTAAANSSSQISLTWSASSTAGVTYSVYSGTSSGSTTNLLASGLSATSYAATGLAASTTYYFTLKAVSSAGSSAASNQASATTQAASSGASCHVSYVDQNDWGSGFTGNLSITNTGSVALTSWTVSWTYGGNQQITQSWNSNYTQSGRSVALTNASWNATIAAGATLSGIGWNANYTGTNSNPIVFYLNGTMCR